MSKLLLPLSLCPPRGTLSRCWLGTGTSLLVSTIPWFWDDAYLSTTPSPWSGAGVFLFPKAQISRLRAHIGVCLPSGTPIPWSGALVSLATACSPWLGADVSLAVARSPWSGAGAFLFCTWLLSQPT